MNFKITQLEPDGKVVTYKQLEYQPVKENQLFTIEIHDDTVDVPSFYSMRVGERLKEVVGERGENYLSFEDLVKHFVASDCFANNVKVTRNNIIVDIVPNFITPRIIENIQNACLGREYTIVFDNNKLQLHISI